MAKSINDHVYDNGLLSVSELGNKMVLCKGIPTTYAEANNLDSDSPAGYKVAEVALSGVDYTIQARAGGGREIVVAAKPGITAADGSTSGNDLHIAILDTANSRMLLLTDETSNQVIAEGNLVNFPSFRYGLPAPV